jgi:uncharacterized protein YxeA
MRKIVFIVLAVIVVAVVVIFCVREFAIPNINYIADFIDDDSNAPSVENRVKIRRLYAAEVDVDAFNNALEQITNRTEFTDEEKLAAAMASGAPEFFPSFNFSLYRAEDGKIRVSGFIDIDTAEGQKNQRFKMGDVALEAIVEGGDLEIEDVEIAPLYENEEQGEIKIHSPQQAAVDITNARTFGIALNGDNGTLTLRFVYNVRSDTFLPKTVLEEQLMHVDLQISLDNLGRVRAQWDVQPYSNLEDEANYG